MIHTTNQDTQARRSTTIKKRRNPSTRGFFLLTAAAMTHCAGAIEAMTMPSLRGSNIIYYDDKPQQVSSFPKNEILQRSMHSGSHSIDTTTSTNARRRTNFLEQDKLFEYFDCDCTDRREDCECEDAGIGGKNNNGGAAVVEENFAEKISPEHPLNQQESPDKDEIWANQPRPPQDDVFTDSQLDQDNHDEAVSPPEGMEFEDSEALNNLEDTVQDSPEVARESQPPQTEHPTHTNTAWHFEKRPDLASLLDWEDNENENETWDDDQHEKGQAEDAANSSSSSSESLTKDQTSSGIPARNIYIFVGLSVGLLLLYALYWRDSKMQERLDLVKKQQDFMGHLFNLYGDDLDNHNIRTEEFTKKTIGEYSTRESTSTELMPCAEL